MTTTPQQGQEVNGVSDGYREGTERPVAGYRVLMGLFAALVTLSFVAIKRSGKDLPERFGLGDILLAGVATHKASRLLAKDKVTSGIRAPFTEYQGKGAPGEVEERPVGSGMRYAIGELLVCPYCLSMWIGTAFALGLVVAPRITRFAAVVLTAVGVSDFLQLAYKTADQTA